MDISIRIGCRLAAAGPVRISQGHSHSPPLPRVPLASGLHRRSPKPVRDSEGRSVPPVLRGTSPERSSLDRWNTGGGGRRPLRDPTSNGRCQKSARDTHFMSQSQGIGLFTCSGVVEGKRCSCRARLWGARRGLAAKSYTGSKAQTLNHKAKQKHGKTKAQSNHGAGSGT